MATNEVRRVSADVPAEDAPRRAEVARQSRVGLRSLAPPEPTVGPGEAMNVHTVALTVTGSRASASVELRWRGEQSLGLADGVCAGGAVDRLVAEAALRAAGGIDPEAALMAIEAVTVAPAGTRLVATAVLAHPVRGGDETVAGAAAVGPSGTADAVARAVVDALVRRSASA